MNYSSIYSTQHVSTTGISSASTALSANTARIAFMVQNCGQWPLFVKLGTGCTDTNFTVVLKAGTVNDDGVGGSFAMETGAVYTGAITIAGNTTRYTATELAP